MPILIKVFVTVRSGEELVDRCVALRSSPTQAKNVAKQYAKAVPNACRAYTRPVQMNANDIAAVITQWGREDAQSGEPRSGQETWTEAWKEAYRIGFDSIVRKE